MANGQTICSHYIVAKLSSVYAMSLILAAGCMGAGHGQLTKKFSRVGESMTLPYTMEAVSNSILLWSRTLTNGYVLYDNRETRVKNVTLSDDPASLFMLRNGTNAIGYWGKSACLPPEKPFYRADIILRVTAASEGSRLSVAIHGVHFVRGLTWNFHTYGFDREKEADLPPCPRDEREILHAIRSAMEKGAVEKVDSDTNH